MAVNAPTSPDSAVGKPINNTGETSKTNTDKKKLLTPEQMEAAKRIAADKLDKFNQWLVQKDSQRGDTDRSEGEVHLTSGYVDPKESAAIAVRELRERQKARRLAKLSGSDDLDAVA